MGQTLYKSDVGYRSILLYLFQLNYNYKVQICFRHVQHFPENISTSRRCKYCPSEWNSSFPSPPASSYTSSSFPACSSPSSTTDQEINITQGRTYSSKILLHAGHRQSKDGKLLTDGRQSLLDMLIQQSTTFCLPYTWSKHQQKARCTPTDVEYSHRRGRTDIWRRMLG